MAKTLHADSLREAGRGTPTPKALVVYQEPQEPNWQNGPSQITPSDG